MLAFSVSDAANTEKATFAGGCFWCISSAFSGHKGVREAVAGYTGGTKEHPTYEEVSTGKTGHFEAVQVTFDPAEISYDELLDIFWRQIDPTDKTGQFADRGSQYRTAIFYHTPEQRAAAERSKKALQESGRFRKPIATDILPAGQFYPAEDYHQNYDKKNPLRYKLYRSGSGRDRFIQETWGREKKMGPVHDQSRLSEKDKKEKLRSKLTEMQYRVTQENGTEPPFRNEYWDNKREGIYVDIASGEPLFSSIDKYDSGTGWPSFTKPLEPSNIVETTDMSLLQTRTEIRSRRGNSHLGHVFPDGPGPGGLRYCMNSASLRFIPKEDLEKEGYGEYLKLFEKQHR